MCAQRSLRRAQYCNGFSLQLFKAFSLFILALYRSRERPQRSGLERDLKKAEPWVLIRVGLGVLAFGVGLRTSQRVFQTPPSPAPPGPTRTPAPPRHRATHGATVPPSPLPSPPPPSRAVSRLVLKYNCGSDGRARIVDDPFDMVPLVLYHCRVVTTRSHCVCSVTV